MPDLNSPIVERAERLMQVGQLAEARRMLVALVDAQPDHGRAWYLLSRLAETAEQRTRFLRRAQAAGYLEPDVEIDAEALNLPAGSPAQSQLAIDPTALRGGYGEAMLRGGCAAVAVAAAGVGVALLLGVSTVIIDLGGVALVFALGAVVGLSVYAGMVRDGK